jgi:hypothetical protein
MSANREIVTDTFRPWANGTGYELWENVTP